jgi:hypothetical protein
MIKLTIRLRSGTETPNYYSVEIFPTYLLIERQRRRRRTLLDDLKERRGYSHLKEEALNRTIWRARFGRGFGSVVRQTTK